MLTVHKLHPAHQLLAENAVAKDARDHGIEEVLVVIHRGEVIRVQTPPGMVSEFVPEDDWMFSAIREAYSLGLSDLGGADITAPKGWTQWANLRPGMVAVDGDLPERLLVIGGPGLFTRHDGHPCTAAWVTMDGTIKPFRFMNVEPPALPFVRVLARVATNTILAAIAARYGTRPIEEILSDLEGAE